MSGCSHSRHRSNNKKKKVKCRQGLSVVKVIVAEDVWQGHLFLLRQSVILSVVDRGLWKSILLKLIRVQNSVMRILLGTWNDAPVVSMWYLLDLFPAETRQKIKQVKAYVMYKPKNSLEDAILKKHTKKDKERKKKGGGGGRERLAGKT